MRRRWRARPRDDDGEQQEEPEDEAAAAGSAGDGGVADGQAKQEQEEGVDTNIHPEEFCRSEKTTHAFYHCMRLSVRSGGIGLGYGDACDCRNLSVASAGCAARDGDASDERPAAGDAVQYSGAAYGGQPVCGFVCGHGAVGIEAMSRGAEHVWFAEDAKAALAAMRANLAEL